jgi:hypothetical protein
VIDSGGSPYPCCALCGLTIWAGQLVDVLEGWQLHSDCLDDPTWELSEQMETIRFGKHRGKLIDEIPEDYLEWLVNSSQATIDQCQRELERRRVAAEANLALAEQIIREGYRALSKKLHPDIGGDEEKMKCLNNDRDRLVQLLKSHMEDD